MHSVHSATHHLSPGEALAQEAALVRAATRETQDHEQHILLESMIREIQALHDPFTSHVSETTLQAIISSVATQVLKNISVMGTIAKMPPNLSLSEVVAQILEVKRERAGSVDKPIGEVTQEVQRTQVGRELLLRVMHAISTVAKALPVQTSSIKEIHTSTAMLAAEGIQAAIIHQALLQESALIASAVAKTQQSGK